MLEMFRTKQPIAYRILQRSLLENRVSHAYLFHGPKETQKLETAILFAQSLICEHPQDGWACETCDTCVRVANHLYADLIILDGTKETIKKEAMESMMKQFSTTALESYGKKVYIIDDAENMTLASMNSLLKFIEEPPGETIYAILCTSQMDRILPTIISRCQNIPFRPMGEEELYTLAMEKEVPTLEAHILSSHLKNLEEIVELSEQKDFQEGLGIWKEFIRKAMKSALEGIYYLQGEIQSKKTKETFLWFLRSGCVFLNDVTHQKVTSDETWDTLTSEFSASKHDATKYTQILLDTLDHLNANAILALALDEMGYQLKKEEEYGK